MLSQRQVELAERMLSGEQLVLTYQSGSFLLLKNGDITGHFFHSEVNPLISDGTISPGQFEGTPPGGHRVYNLKIYA